MFIERCSIKYHQCIFSLQSPSSSVVETKIWRSKVTTKDITLYKGFNYEEILLNVPFDTTPSTETTKPPSDTVQESEDEIQVIVEPLETEKPSKWQEGKKKKVRFIETPLLSTTQLAWMETDDMPVVKRKLEKQGKNETNEVKKTASSTEGQGVRTGDPCNAVAQDPEDLLTKNIFTMTELKAYEKRKRQIKKARKKQERQRKIALEEHVDKPSLKKRLIKKCSKLFKQ